MAGKKEDTKGNKRNVERFAKIVDHYIAQIVKEKNKLKYEYAMRVKKAFNRIKQEVVGDGGLFYRDYWPIYYKRHYDLVRIPKITIDTRTGTYEYHLNSDHMKKWHRIFKKLGAQMGREFIMQLSFIDGFHGGARDGGPDFLGNPFPGSYDQPYWRTPPEERDGIPKYGLWGRPAKRFKKGSPAEILLDRFEESELGIRRDIVGKMQLKAVELLKYLKEGYIRYINDPNVIAIIDGKIKSVKNANYVKAIKK